MQFDGESHIACYPEYAFGLLKIKTNGFAENIHCYCQVLVDDLGQYGCYDQLHIVIGSALVFWRNGVGTQKRGHNLCLCLCAQLLYDSQQFELIM